MQQLDHLGAGDPQGDILQFCQVPLRLGDVLLPGRKEVTAEMNEVAAFNVLGPIESMEKARPKRRHAPLAITIFVAVLALATFKVLTLPPAPPI